MWLHWRAGSSHGYGGWLAAELAGGCGNGSADLPAD
jgi:hypothetical protein